MPEESDSHERAHKLPFLISDIFGQENSRLLEAFFDEEISDNEETEETEENSKEIFDQDNSQGEELKEDSQENED